MVDGLGMNSASILCAIQPCRYPKDAGIPQAVVQELIGHESEAMSALYTHVGSEALRKAASALPVI
jgi:hypothetical protein